MIFIDTDARLFNDDCAAIGMLLSSASTRSQIRGIVAVPGNVWAPEAARAASELLKIAGRTDIPIFLGAQRPFLQNAASSKYFEQQWTLNYRGAFALPFESETLSPENNGVDFLAKLILNYPGQVTIAALGPLTNVALLLTLYPGLETIIRRIVWMGGTLRASGNATEKAEFNFWFDPESAQVVLRSRIRDKIMIGLDVCNYFSLTCMHFTRIASSSSPFAPLYNQGFGHNYPGFLSNPNATCLLWDELAAAYLIEPDLAIRWEEAFLDVDCTFRDSYGSTTVLNRELAPDATPVKAVLEMKIDDAFELYTNLLS